MTIFFGIEGLQRQLMWDKSHTQSHDLRLLNLANNFYVQISKIQSELHCIKSEGTLQSTCSCMWSEHHTTAITTLHHLLTEDPEHDQDPDYPGPGQRRLRRRGQPRARPRQMGRVL